MSNELKCADYVFKTTPYNHQLEAFMLSRDKKAYALLMEMGTGKTKVGIDTTAWLFGQGKINGLVIVAPKSICRNWAEKELPTHLPDNVAMKKVLWGGNHKKLEEQLKTLSQVEPLSLHVLVMNIEALSTDRGYDAIERFLRTHDTMMIVDESTTIKNHSATRTKIAIKLGKLAKFRRIMTGTPVTQSPLDVYSQFDFLEYGALGSSSFYGFRTQYAVLRKRYLNGKSFDEVVGYQRLEELQKIMKPLSYRALKRDCLDLPDKVYEVRYIELTKEQRNFYEEFKENALAMLSDGTVVAAPLVITQLLRLRQALCNLVPSETGPRRISDVDPRANEVMNLLEEAPTAKVIIWANFIDCIKNLKHMIGEKYGAETVGCIYGDVSQEDRQRAVNAFQDMASPVKYMVMQPRTGGFGLTLTAATLVIYHDNDWSLEVRQQSEDRAHRIGQKNTVTYVDLIAAGTIDEKIRAALLDKRDLADKVTGDALRELLR